MDGVVRSRLAMCCVTLELHVREYKVHYSFSYTVIIRSDNVLIFSRKHVIIISIEKNNHTKNRNTLEILNHLAPAPSIAVI